ALTKDGRHTLGSDDDPSWFGSGYTKLDAYQIKILYCPSNRSSGPGVDVGTLIQNNAILTAAVLQVKDPTGVVGDQQLLNPNDFPDGLGPTDFKFCFGSNAALASHFKRPTKSIGVFG